MNAHITPAGTTASPPATPQAHIGVRFDRVSHWFVNEDGATQVLEDINLEVPDREFVAIVGASGCGKTTLLNMVAGLYAPTEGTLDVRIGAERLKLPSNRVGYM